MSLGKTLMQGSFNNRYIRFWYYTDMAQTLCIKCGSELKASSYCQLCQQPLIFACPSCEYITDEKVHPDCRNAEILAKTDATTIQEGSTITAASTTSGPRSTTGNQQQSIVNKSKEEISKAEQSSTPSYMTTEQDNDKNSNINPFTASSAAWQSLVTYWMYTYGEFVKNALKMTEEWCNVFWKPG